MPEANGSGRWKVGELAAATGLTVRTLHHWEAQGVVAPSSRTAAGHRLYDEDDVRRVYAVVALRELALPLETVAGLLAGPGPDLAEVLAAHVAGVRARLDALRAMELRLTAVLAHARRTGAATTSDLLGLIDEVTTMDETIKQYFSADQMEALAQRRAHLGDEHIRSVEAEWPELIARVQAEMDAGTDPAEPRVQALGARWAELVAEFHGGDPGLRDSLYRMYEERSEEVQATGGPDPEMISYVTRAQQAADAAGT